MYLVLIQLLHFWYMFYYIIHGRELVQYMKCFLLLFIIFLST